MMNEVCEYIFHFLEKYCNFRFLSGVFFLRVSLDVFHEFEAVTRRWRWQKSGMNFGVL